MFPAAPLQGGASDLGTLLAVAVVCVVVATVLLVGSVELVDADEKRALTVFGEFRGVLEPGPNLVPPFVSRTESFRTATRTTDVAPRDAMTLDDEPVAVDAAVHFAVEDVERVVRETDDVEPAIARLAERELRAVIGELTLDDAAADYHGTNARVRDGLDERADALGVRVDGVEIREISPRST